MIRSAPKLYGRGPKHALNVRLDERGFRSLDTVSEAYAAILGRKVSQSVLMARALQALSDDLSHRLHTLGPAKVTLEEAARLTR